MIYFILCAFFPCLNICGLSLSSYFLCYTVLFLSMYLFAVPFHLCMPRPCLNSFLSSSLPYLSFITNHNASILFVYVSMFVGLPLLFPAHLLLCSLKPYSFTFIPFTSGSLIFASYFSILALNMNIFSHKSPSVWC